MACGICLDERQSVVTQVPTRKKKKKKSQVVSGFQKSLVVFNDVQDRMDL